MASKYLSAGSATFTAATRTIAGATMTAAFVAGDIGKAISMVKDGAVYFGTILSVTNGTDIILTQGPGLPGTNGSVTQLLVIDAGRTHGHTEYMAEIESKVSQDVEKIDIAGRRACLQEALDTYDRDRPYIVPIRVAGTGADTYALAAALGSWWVPGESGVQEIEYPVNEKPASFMDDEDWRIYNDGTVQDGSTSKLVFLDQVPGASSYFVVHTRTPRIMDQVTAGNFPDTSEAFMEITTLAGSLLCDRLAAAFAQSSNAAISADVVEYHGKTDKYRTLGKALKEKYNSSVFGSIAGASEVQPAIIEKPIDTTNSLGGTYLFHRRRH
jgi:hypothetical protein